MRFGPPIEELAKGQRCEDLPVHVVEATASTTKDGKPYGRYKFRDRTGLIEAIRWEHQITDDENGAIALVSGVVEDYRSKPQLKVSRLEILTDPPALVLDRLRKEVDADLGRRLVTQLHEVQATLTPLFWRIFELSLGHDPFDTTQPFWTYAAAQSKHHAEAGGLAWHVLSMVRLADAIAPFYDKLDVDLLRLAILTHDLGKIDCYEMGAAGARQLSVDRSVGHTAYSISRVLRAIERLRAEGVLISREDEEALLHCIAAHHGRKEWGAYQDPNTAEASALHAIDLLDSQIRGAENERKELPDRGPGPAAKPRLAPVEPLRPEPADDPFVAADEDEDAPDPFQVDDDDPFDDEPPAAPRQPSLF